MEFEAYPHGSPFTNPNHFRKAAIRRVIDGDSVYLDCELIEGIAIIKERCRLARINAPEMSTQDGPLSKAHLESLSKSHGCDLSCVVELLPKDNYGRRLIVIWSDDGSVNLNDKMVADGFAKVLEEGKT